MTTPFSKKRGRAAILAGTKSPSDTQSPISKALGKRNLRSNTKIVNNKEIEIRPSRSDSVNPKTPKAADLSSSKKRKSTGSGKKGTPEPTEEETGKVLAFSDSETAASPKEKKSPKKASTRKSLGGKAETKSAK
mmetsp:Transcript_23227/g.38189  ORF Transcript_23227/g.38189 Transcript_23227/m.38189 type:complete len:134 (-) Transcript_23227:292-693(-)|eukprot:CAMPEP_0184656906 /NCGR_PEP_ID=MMETSP0308-20130426/16837_1 /TAXON_ID=38269 /ORGANISM="Gloeochaete witrockiana, Strain SAG 46.84" /LENGTH=133 /DNA_ID=CAMNT_0027094227 /DNA_START=140 /DNA_END=541 /DNA_ORIENTATION=-